MTLALNGLSGEYLAQTCESVQALEAAYENIAQLYQPDALYFDIENNLQTDNTKLDRMMQAIKTLKRSHPGLKISFTLPVCHRG